MLYILAGNFYLPPFDATRQTSVYHEFSDPEPLKARNAAIRRLGAYLDVFLEEQEAYFGALENRPETHSGLDSYMDLIMEEIDETHFDIHNSKAITRYFKQDVQNSITHRNGQKVIDLDIEMESEMGLFIHFVPNEKDYYQCRSGERIYSELHQIHAVCPQMDKQVLSIKRGLVREIQILEENDIEVCFLHKDYIFDEHLDPQLIIKSPHQLAKYYI